MCVVDVCVSATDLELDNRLDPLTSEHRDAPISASPVLGSQVGSGPKPCLYACKASTVPARLSIAPAQPFLLHFNPSFPHHLWVPFPPYLGVPKPSSSHVCIKCIPANEVGLTPARTSALVTVHMRTASFFTGKGFVPPTVG